MNNKHSEDYDRGFCDGFDTANDLMGRLRRDRDIFRRRTEIFSELVNAISEHLNQLQYEPEEVSASDLASSIARMIKKAAWEASYEAD